MHHSRKSVISYSFWSVRWSGMVQFCDWLRAGRPWFDYSPRQVLFCSLWGQPNLLSET